MKSVKMLAREETNLNRRCLSVSAAVQKSAADTFETLKHNGSAKE